MVKCHVIHVNPLSVSSLSDLMTEGQRSTKKIHVVTEQRNTLYCPTKSCCLLLS